MTLMYVLMMYLSAQVQKVRYHSKESHLFHCQTTKVMMLCDIHKQEIARSGEGWGQSGKTFRR